MSAMRQMMIAAALIAAPAAAQHQHHQHHQHAPAAKPVQQVPRPAPPNAQLQAQLAALNAAVARYRDFEVAKREGWKKFGGDGPLMGEHWYLPKERGGLDYVGRQPIDVRRPSNLMYTTIGGKRVLTGVTFNVRIAPGQPVPEGFAGASDVWHVHDFEQAVGAALKDRPVLRWMAQNWLLGPMRAKGDDHTRLAMIHVWVGVPNPDGPFADKNRLLPYLKLGLPTAFASGASMDAAKGLHLATPQGCSESIDGGAWIANIGAGTKRELHRACAAAAAHVREGLASRDPRHVNAMGEHGWHAFDASWQRLLTPEQKARIAAITEHGEHGSH
jgi:hypothetical protein